MDNQTFVAKYIADESVRLNESLKEMLAKGEAPSDSEKDALFSDMEVTLSRLTKSLEYLMANVDVSALDNDEDLPVA